MADEEVKNEEAAPVATNAKGIVKQIEAEFQKEKNGAFKTELKKLMTKRVEAEKAVRLVDAEIADLTKKFEAGLI